MSVHHTSDTHSRSRTPRLYIGAFSNQILCAPKWKQRKDGLEEATGQTFDVTQNALAVVAKYIEENDVTQTDTKTGKKYRLSLAREEIA